jgi:sec-independent protein translocase protein TatB
MIGDMSFGDTAFIFVLALLIFGPKKLPEIARQVGKALNEFKRASNEFKAQIQSEIDQLEVKEKQKKAEEEQKTLPPAAPPPGAVHSSYLMPPEYASSPAAPATPESATPAEHSPEPPVRVEAVNPPVPDTTNV